MYVRFLSLFFFIELKSTENNSNENEIVILCYTQCIAYENHIIYNGQKYDFFKW